MRMLGAVVMAAFLPALAPVGSSAELSVGITGGLVFSGDQDVKFKQFGPDGQLLSVSESRGVSASIGPVGGVTLAVWGDDRWSHLGVQMDALYWTTSVDVDERTPEPGSRLTIDQTRGALLLSLLGRLPFGDPDSLFIYLGLGGGLVQSRVRHGDEDLGPAVGALGGIAIPLSSRLRLRVEMRYLITSDVEARPRPGLRVETSGSSRGNGGRLLFGPHLDTQFLPLLVGLDWLF